MEWIISHQQGARRWALDEVAQGSGGLEKELALSPEITLVRTTRYPGQRWHPTFVRHRFPVDVKVKPELEALAEAAGEFRPRMKKNRTFSVQARALEGSPVTAREVETALEESLRDAASFDRNKPFVVISVVVGPNEAWMGLSAADDNLSPWNGGQHHLAKREDQISRAEFKLSEALEAFHLRPKKGQRVLDLGAAPGGWSRIFAERGLKVTAVDPAQLDPRLKGVEHQRMTAQKYLKTTTAPYHWLLNDMKMDAVESAKLTVEFFPRLARSANVLMTLKLPEGDSAPEKLAQALKELHVAYQILQVKQLFHNRNEVTVWMEPLRLR